MSYADKVAAEVERRLADGELSPQEARTLAARVGAAADEADFDDVGVTAKSD